MKKAVLLAAMMATIACGWRFRVALGLVPSAATDVVLTGFLEGEERILRSEVAGIVTEVLVREGEVVARGTPLLRIDEREAKLRRAQQANVVGELQARVEQARRSLELTRNHVDHATKISAAEVAYAAADLDLARRTLKRAQETTAARAMAVHELDEAEARVRKCEAALERAEETEKQARDGDREVRVAESALAVLEASVAVESEKLGELDLILSKHEIVAEAPGTVQDRLIRAGELAQPGRALVSLLDEDDKYVRIYVPVPLLGRFRVGTPVTVELDQSPGQRFAGTVEWIDSRAEFTPRNIFTPDDRTQQVYEARVRVERGTAHDVRAGAEASVRLAAGPAAGGS